jgi:hypothetical protein
MKRTVIAVLALTALTPTRLAAQTAEQAVLWGITASVTPRWSAAGAVKHYVDADQYDISGGEFTVGFVRGRSLGAEWGVSLVRKSVEEGSTSRFGTFSVCYQQQCVERSTTFVARNVSLLGVEAHKFFNLVTIRRRVQIGVNLAAGVVQVRGQAEKTLRYATLVTDPATGDPRIQQVTEVSMVDGGQIFSGGNEVSYAASAKVEAGVGFILNRNVKVRVTGGVNFPGYHIASFHVIYLFGRGSSIFG